jgi:tetratricopeptide (TPR) repeat protein
MTIIAFLALLGWIPVVVYVFLLMPPRRAAAVAVVGAWLLLPPVLIGIPGLPDYSKTTAAIAGVALASVLFAPDYLLKFRPRWFDLPMVLICVSDVCTSLLNGLGLYDGLSVAFGDFLTWTLPYLFGRIYFGDPEGLRIFVVTMVIGGLVYIAPCLLETQISPQLLQKIYGVTNVVAWSRRYGGYRPQVFFGTGLECSLWMTAASLAGGWLWYCGSLKKVGGIRFGSVLLPILIATTILSRSTGALILLAAGTMVLWLSCRFKTRLLLAGLLLVGPLYVTVRVSQVWSGQEVVDLIENTLGHAPAYSLQYRFGCEDMLIVKAVQQPFFGWGAYGRSAAYWEETGQNVITDGMWIILLGFKGFAGLTLVYLGLILPAIRFVWRFPPGRWREPELAAASLAAVLLGLYVIDCLLNGFANVVYVVLGGGLAGLTPKQLRTNTDKSGLETAAGASKINLAIHNHDLGRALKGEGRFKDAEAVWTHTLDSLGPLVMAYPGNPDLRRRWCDCANDLAWLKLHYFEAAHGDPSASIALARRAVEECPEVAVYWNTLGTAYYRSGDDAAAVAALDRAIALGGSTAFDNVFLAMAHARLGDREHAEHLLAQAVLELERRNPAHPELVRFCHEARSIFAESSRAPSNSVNPNRGDV